MSRLCAQGIKSSGWTANPNPAGAMLRFSLRTLLVSILVAGAGLGLLVRERNALPSGGPG